MISINFVGDVAIFNEFEIQGVDPLKAVSLPKANLNIANLEFPFNNNREKYFYDVSDNYSVSFSYAKNINISTFNLYGLANNHILDYGSEGIADTCEVLTNNGSNYFGISGDDEYDCHYEEINGISFVFVAAVKPGRWGKCSVGPNIIVHEKIGLLVTQLKHTVDHVIIYLHWGSELIDAPIPSDVFFARSLIDNGARCVIGHHPHVSQGIEEYNNGLIAYSLGSFIYLSEFEKGNIDKAEIRDLSICLNISFSKDSITSFTPYKYIRDKRNLVPLMVGDFNEDKYFTHLNAVIGNVNYYSSRIRRVLLKREFYSFLVRFRKKPILTLIHYSKYLKLSHLAKIIGLSKHINKNSR